jgi:hypothetical protein
MRTKPFVWTEEDNEVSEFPVGTGFAGWMGSNGFKLTESDSGSWHDPDACGLFVFTNKDGKVALGCFAPNAERAHYTFLRNERYLTVNETEA